MDKSQNGKAGKVRLYLAVDVGGTKIQSSLVDAAGAIRARERCATPRDGGPEEVVAAIQEDMEALLEAEGISAGDLTAVGIAVPGVVDPDTGYVVVTPNMSLTGVHIGPLLEKRFGVPVAVGNDCDVGTLGEAWLGAARNARSAVGILVGTGIGAGIVYGRGKMWRGSREAAAEIGHIVMQIGGPLCGCGNRGCLEALASRSAIERDLRAAVEKGRTTVLIELLEGDLGVIKSGALKKALAGHDELVTEIMRRASEVLGYACLTVRHLLDPEVIVLGGGVVEACSDFILPIVENIVGSDQLAGAREGGRVLLSALGDDAVVVGAVAMARRHVGRNPFKKKYAVRPKYPRIDRVSFGEVTVGGKSYANDVVIRVNGKIRKRNKQRAREQFGTSHKIGPKELESVCKGGPEMVFIGAGHNHQVELTEEAEQFLAQRSIQCKVVPTPEVIEAYNKSPDRKAALIHVTC